MPKMDFFDFFEDLTKPEEVENLSIWTNFGQFWLYFINLNHVLKKVGRGRSHDLTYFQIDVFGIYMLWGGSVKSQP
jgi:hypothetical protein